SPSGLPNDRMTTAFTISPRSGVGRARNGSSRSIPTLTDAPVRLAKVRGMPDHLTHPLRSDARDNRDRILEAARTLFATDGLGVPMREIARLAEVGPATLYR